MATDQEIIIIAAMSENRVIGRDNALPWHLKADLIHFRELTCGWPCVMGRKTWESLPRRPLPGRLNVIVSACMEKINRELANELAINGNRRTEVSADVKIVPSLAAAIEACAAYQKIFICGGEAIFREAMMFADKIELTVIHQHIDGDVFFPEIDPSQWVKTDTMDFDTHSFIVYSKMDFTTNQRKPHELVARNQGVRVCVGS